VIASFTATSIFWLKRMGTIGEEIFSLKLERRIHAGEIVLVAMDLTMSHDATPPSTCHRG